jgi:hypothetical protein
MKTRVKVVKIARDHNATHASKNCIKNIYKKPPDLSMNFSFIFLQLILIK